MLDYLYLGLYKLFGFLLWILPDVLIRVLMKGLGWVAYMFSAKHRNIIYSNLELAFKPPLEDKEKKEIRVHAFMNLIDTVFGIIRRDGMNRDEVKMINIKRSLDNKLWGINSGISIFFILSVLFLHILKLIQMKMVLLNRSNRFLLHLQ